MRWLTGLLVMGALVVGVPPAGAAVVEQHENGTIAFADWETGLGMVDPDGSDYRLTFDGALAPDWSNDGTKLAYTRLVGTNHDIYLANPDGTGEVRLTFAHGAEGHPSWSPDGSKIAFSSDGGGRDAVYTMNADGSQRKPLVDLPGHWVNKPRWSPDGSRIAVSVDPLGDQDSYVATVRPDGTGFERLTFGLDAAGPSWSASGTELAYAGRNGADKFVMVLRADGSGWRRLTPSSLKASDPVWSPDGTRILFTVQTGSFGSTQTDLYTIRPDGTDLRQVTKTPAISERDPAWQPLPVRHVSVHSASVAEGEGTATFAVRLNKPAAHPLTVDFATVGGTATPSVDFAPVSGTLTFAPGEQAKAVDVSIVGDVVSEPNESFQLRVGATSATGWILNDEPARISVADVAASEGSQAGALSFVIRLAHPTTKAVRVGFRTLDGSALAGQDYVATEGAVDVAPGQTAVTVAVPIVPDVVPEPNETLAFELLGPVGGSVVDGAAVGTIGDDDSCDGPVTCS